MKEHNVVDSANQRPSEVAPAVLADPSSQGREWVLSVIARAYQIAGTGDTSRMVQELLDLFLEVTQADSAYFFEFETATNESVIAQVRGDVQGQYLVGLRLNHQQGIPGLVLSTSQVTVIDDLTADPEWVRMVVAVNLAHKLNVICVPVATNGCSLGVIQLFNFKQSENDLLMVLGNHLATELDRRKEIAQVQQSKQRLLNLVDMLGDVAGTLDRKKLLHLVTENAARLVGAERSSLFLVDPNTSQMVYQVAYQPPEGPPCAATRGETGPLGKSEQTETQVSPAQAKRKNGFNGGEFSYFNRSAITVPLRSESRTNAEDEDKQHVLGGLMVLNNGRSVFHEEDAQLIRILANQASTFLQVAEMYESSEELFLGVIRSLVTAIDAKDSYTQGHSQRVSDYSVLLAQELGMDASLINDIRIGSLLHDIGKIGIPDSILLKKCKLTFEEMEIMKEHPSTGVSILSQVKMLDPMLPCILEHHERLDGSGYPSNLTEKHITWMGRIVAVADVYDAMTSKRPYRDPNSSEEVLAYLDKMSGKLYDANCVQALSNIVSRSNWGHA